MMPSPFLTKTTGRRRWLPRFLLGGLVVALIWFWLLPAMGRFLVEEDRPAKADAAVVLSTGMAYYPRLMEAAALFREGRVPLVVINGNRKTDSLRRLETLRFKPAAPWNENSLRVLELLGVPRDRVISVSAEKAFDTISEARAVAQTLQGRGLHSLMLVTSKSHTRRAGHIWRNRVPGGFRISTAGAREDPIQADAWWHSGRQIRWLLAEYGGWLFYFIRWMSEEMRSRTLSARGGNPLSALYYSYIWRF